MWSVFIVSLTVIGIVAIQNWGEAQAFRAAEAQASADAMENLNKALDTIKGTKNTDILILDKLRDLYGTNNIQAEIANAQKWLNYLNLRKRKKNKVLILTINYY